MPEETSAPPAPSEAAPAQNACTLEPLLTQGPDSLAPDTTHPGLIARLCSVAFAQADAFHVVTLITADDLFRSAAAGGKSKIVIPVGAKLIHATLAITLPGSPHAHTVNIRPPDTIKFEFPADAPLVTSFLSKRRFLTARKFASLIILLLALADPLLPDTADDDDDNGDDDDNHHSTHLRI
jgi:hypothetical protein